MTSAPRRYGGASAEERVAERRSRLLAAGLELMGTKGIAGAGVRGVSEQAGLAARYFYESFPSVDDLHVAVFDQIAEEALHRSLAAVARTPADDRAEVTRVVLAEMVDLFLSDPRKGRVVLLESVASPVLGARALEESRRFATMLAATAATGDPLRAEASVEMRLVAQFLIGGVGQTIGAVLQGEIEVDRDALVATLVDLFLTVDASRPGVRR